MEVPISGDVMQHRSINFWPWVLGALIGATGLGFQAQMAENAGSPGIPRTWEDGALASLEVPLAEPKASAVHVPADYYYRIPVRPIYKQYPVYGPGREPSGYMEWLKQQEPLLVWGGEGKDAKRPPLATELDWIKAGEIVFDAPIAYGPDVGPSIEDVRDPAWYKKTGVPVSKDGVMALFSYAVRKKGEVELAGFGCATCHTRLMPDGVLLKGAQGNLPVDGASITFMPRPTAEQFHQLARRLWGTPWLRPDPLAGLKQTTAEEFVLMIQSVLPGVEARQGTSPFYPPQIPDLIGVKELRYLDHTGLVQHRSIVDLMRYAAINQGEDLLSSYAGFIPEGLPPDFQKRPEPTDARLLGRYSDEQLYALALYVYSLQPPPNPNKFDALAGRGQKVFERERCQMCHTPPLYTNNMLTPVEGFTPPEEHMKKFHILPISIGTDSTLALKTRRGTGYYKVPSLKGVWYRGPFEHNGSVARLEDWFDPRRTHDDYVPTGFVGYGVKTRAVKGHPFGLALSEADRKALIAFLKTL